MELRGGGAYENSQNHEGMGTAHIMSHILTNSPYEKEKKIVSIPREVKHPVSSFINSSNYLQGTAIPQQNKTSL